MGARGFVPGCLLRTRACQPARWGIHGKVNAVGGVTRRDYPEASSGRLAAFNFRDRHTSEMPTVRGGVAQRGVILWFATGEVGGSNPSCFPAFGTRLQR